MRNSLSNLSAQYISNTLTTIVNELPPEKKPENVRKVVSNIFTLLMFLRDDFKNKELLGNVESARNVTVNNKYVSLNLFSKIIKESSDTTLRKLTDEVKNVTDLINRSKKPLADKYTHTFDAEDRSITRYTSLYITVAVATLFVLANYLCDTVINSEPQKGEGDSDGAQS
jgi:hypothetical protein